MADDFLEIIIPFGAPLSRTTTSAFLWLVVGMENGAYNQQRPGTLKRLQGAVHIYGIPPITFSATAVQYEYSGSRAQHSTAPHHTALQTVVLHNMPI